MASSIITSQPHTVLLVSSQERDWTIRKWMLESAGYRVIVTLATRIGSLLNSTSIDVVVVMEGDANPAANEAVAHSIPLVILGSSESRQQQTKIKVEYVSNSAGVGALVGVIQRLVGS